MLDAGVRSAVPGAKQIGPKTLVHPAIKHLPVPDGSGKRLAFRDGANQQQGLHEPKHQADTPDGQAKIDDEQHGGFRPPQQVASMHYSKDQLNEWGYPKYDEKFDNPEWLKEQFRKEREDPRENDNFWLDPSHPSFFHNATRKPYAKALLDSERHWWHRKNLWLEQFDNVRQSNEGRQSVCDMLESCFPETKRLVLPIIKHRVVEVMLMHVAHRALQSGIAFEEEIESEEHKAVLEDFRRTADSSGARGMEDLFRAWEFRCTRHQLEAQAAEEKALKLRGGALGTMEELKDALNDGLRFKEDGVLEWNRGNTEAAITNWREAHKALYKVRAPDTHPEESRSKKELHVAVLKNLSQAAIKLGNWNEALESADMAVTLDDLDHKAWFRKACALEGLGRLREVEKCLVMIDTIAVGRPDQDRILKDVQVKREKVQALANKDQASQKKMLQEGLQKAVFSDERVTKAVEAPRNGPPLISHKVEVLQVDDARRKKLTRLAAGDILTELKGAYQDKTFRKQVQKLAHDVTDQGEFIAYLNKVALPVQKPVLERFGFEPSDLGVAEMRKAIQDHTRAEGPDAHSLRVLAEETMEALYGDFYQVARGAGLQPENRAPNCRQAQRRRRAEGNSDDSSDDSDRGTTSRRQPAACLHWTGRPVNFDASLAASDNLGTSKGDAPRGVRRGGAAGAGFSRPGGDAAAKPGITAAQRKEIWAELTKQMNGSDPEALRTMILRAIETGFSAITIRSAKRALVAMGGDDHDLP